MEEAKQLSEQVLDVALQSQLSTFFLAQLVFSFGAIAAWVTKVRAGAGVEAVSQKRSRGCGAW